jgi:putative membrane protein
VSVVGLVAAGVAALAHVWFFVLESVLFSRPAVAARFGLTEPSAVRAVRPMAFNQGFYNLALAVGAAAGIVAVTTGSGVAGRTLIVFACGCMVLAGVVLLLTDRRFLPAAAVQAVPPLVAVVATLLG